MENCSESGERIPSRKRQLSLSESASPSKEILEQNLKKKKIDTSEINISTENTNNSTRRDSEVCNQIHTENDTISASHGKVEILNETEELELKHKLNRFAHKEIKSEDLPSNSDVATVATETDNKDIVKDVDNKNNTENSELENRFPILKSSKLESSELDSEKMNTTNENDKSDEPTQLSSNTDEEAVIQKEKLINPVEHTPVKKIKLDNQENKLTPKQLQKKMEAEKKHQEKQKEKEGRMKKRLEEKERILQEKLKKKEMKDKEIEQKKEERKKEREEKEEKKRKEREEKEQKRKEKEEKEEQKRKEVEEKTKEKLKEEEKKQKAAAAFVNFFVPKKSEELQDEKKVQTSYFLEFEVKSDMKLPQPRRKTLTVEDKEELESYLKNQDQNASYLKDLSSGKSIGKSLKTWPFEETVDDDIILVDLGETIFEDKSSLQKYKAKFLYFHENRRPAYYGTWRKKSHFVTSRKPFSEDKSLLNYEEDSDDDWEEEEQGESLNGSEDEAEKENEDEKDDYEVDNEFFVPHGHLSEDEVDDEEIARLSPESLKQKLKLLKEEFDQDMQSKTHKLKPRSIGCIWYNKDGSNVDEAIDRYLQPLAVITRHHRIEIKTRIDISTLTKDRKQKISKELDPELVPQFLKLVHGSSNKKSVLAEKFLADVQKSGSPGNISKGLLIRKLKQFAIWEKYKDVETKRYKFHWSVHPDLREKYDLSV